MLIQGCSGGSPDSSENTVINATPPPQDGIRGRASSRISGGKLSVTDAQGEEIVVATGRNTNANGSFHLIFSEFAIEAGIKPPLVVTLDGSGATADCDYDGPTDNDCVSADGSFVAFGNRYTLPDDFTLRGLAQTFPPEDSPGDRTVTVNLSAASDLAARYLLDQANGATLTEEAIAIADRQSLGVVEFLTGLPTRGKTLNTISIADLTSTSAQPTESLAIALLGASLHGQITTATSGLSSYRLVLNRLGNRIRPNTAGDQMNAAGTFLAEAIGSYITSATAYQASLPLPSAILNGAIAASTVSQGLLTQAGNSPVPIALPADPGGAVPIDRTRTFVARFSEVMGSTLLNAQTVAFGGTAKGAATVYSDQLTLLSTLVSQELKTTLTQLDDATTTALANGALELTGTNVSGVLESGDGSVIIKVATSTSSNIQTGISINLTMTEGTRTNPGATGQLTGTGVTIAVSQTLNNLTTQQLFEGTLNLDLSNTGSGTAIERVTFQGDLRATSGLQFTGDIAMSELGSADQNQANYNAGFSFVDGSTLTMNGQLQTQINSTSINSGNSTILVDHVTNRITDMTTDLNLSVNTGGSVTGGILTSSDVDTGTMDSQGVISFNDGTATALPAPIL